MTSNYLHGQSIKKEKTKINNRTLTYYHTEPSVKAIGILVLLTGTGEPAQSIFTKTNLPKVLAEKGYVTIIPEIQNFLVGNQSQLELLDALFETQGRKYNVVNFIVGGLSAGGALATRYAEYLFAKNTTHNLRGLIAIDPPLDLERIYVSAESLVKKCDGLIKKEGYSIINQLNNSLGGPPENHLNNYINQSSYSASATDGGNARHLKNLPIRLYSEPDLDFVQKTYCSELQFNNINAFDVEGLSKFLLKIGNTQSKYVSTKGKGFHSWNIVEPVECTDWILSITK